MSTHFTKSFMSKEFKEHRENIVLERELGMMQATQPDVEDVIRRRKIKQEIEDLIIKNNESYSLKNELENQHTASTKQELKLALDLLREVKKTIREMNNQIRTLRNNYYSVSYDPVKPKEFIRKCTVEDCKGFLSTSLKCGICETFSCKDCREVIGNTTEDRKTHICDSDILESVKCMIKEAKPCPKCASMISKIDGCDQMFCLQCHTAFSWKTLRIETGVIHNPHYFEWRSQNGTQQRNLLEVQCGREIDHEIVGILNRICNTDIIYNIARNVLHIRQVELPKYAVNRFNDNSDLRIRYLRSQITEKVFKQTLQKRFKTNEKKNEIGAVIATYTHCVTDIIYRLIVEYKNPQAIIDLTNDTISPIESKYYYELQELIRYTNDCFKNISKIYKNKPIQITTGGYLS